MTASLLELFAAHKAASWAPASLPNLVAWYDASDAASITQSGGAVSQWNDKSGNGWHATQGTATNKPTTGTRTINGLNVLDFDGTNDFLSMSASLMGSATAGSMLFVAQADADPPGSSTASGAAVWVTASDAQTAHQPFTDGNIYETFGTANRKTVGNPTPSTATNPWQYTVVSAASDFRAYVNGSSLFTTASNTVSWALSGQVPHIGSSYSATTYFYDGRIAEIILLGAAISGTDQTTAQAYLKAKWGTP